MFQKVGIVREDDMVVSLDEKLSPIVNLIPILVLPFAVSLLLLMLIDISMILY